MPLHPSQPPPASVQRYADPAAQLLNLLPAGAAGAGVAAGTIIGGPLQSRRQPERASGEGLPRHLILGQEGLQLVQEAGHIAIIARHSAQPGNRLQCLLQRRM